MQYYILLEPPAVLPCAIDAQEIYIYILTSEALKTFLERFHWKAILLQLEQDETLSSSSIVFHKH